jgi:hypothetical protein
MAVKHLRRTAARQDDTYGKIVQAFLNLLHEQGGVISKEDVLKEAQATAWASMVRWAYVIDFVTKENPGVVILCLTWRFFASPREPLDARAESTLQCKCRKRRRARGCRPSSPPDLNQRGRPGGMHTVAGCIFAEARADSKGFVQWHPNHGGGS